MLTVNKVFPQGQGLATALVKRAATLALPWDERQKSRFDATDSQGRHLGVFLPRGQVLRGGDVLLAEDGSFISVQAAPQPLLRVSTRADGQAVELMRAAYHLGNRHVALEVQPGCLKFEPDHVLAELLRALQLDVTEEHSAFEPEAGAYASSPGQKPAHAHVHGHDDHETAPAASAAASRTTAPAATPAATAQPAPRGQPLAIRIQAAAAPHVHGPGCQHGDHEH